jgi:hypothetical protein
MARVGILTFHHAHNFGAVLQAWSVAASVRALGHEATVINYQPVIGHQPARRGWRRFVPSLGKIRMQRFVRQHLPLSGPALSAPAEVDAHVDAKNYDCLICGSDQVWMIYDHQGVDRPYFLGVGKTTAARRISYAPSAGIRTSFDRFSDEVKGYLTRFDSLCVRDANTAAAVTALGLPAPVRVLDPTLIADFTPLRRARGARADIVVVGKMDAAANRYIRFAAGRLGCKVRVIGARAEGADVQRPFAGPAEWLNEIGDARLVVTSLFHGAAVAMALRTPFVALDCGGRAFKLEDLCGYLGVPERLLLRGDKPDYDQDAALLAMDCDALAPRLDAERAQSRAYLEAAIRG